MLTPALVLAATAVGQRALDHVTTAALTPQALTSAFERLLQRLVVLAALHGKGVPADFLTALATTSEDVDVVDLTAAFLEHGTATMPETTSEIQQEIVHFSRIVDIGQLGLGDAQVEHALRRLRGSQRLPDSLKVLSELIVVVRSRLAQRGRPSRRRGCVRRQPRNPILARMSLQQRHERIPTTGSPYGVAVAVFDASSATSCPCCWPT